MIVLLATIALVAGLAIVHGPGDDRSHPGRAEPLAGGAQQTDNDGSFSCPGELPIAGYHDHSAYPPGHPSMPSRRVSPDICFGSVGDAVANGYTVAPPPRGTLLVAGVYLAPAARQLENQCRAAARAAPFQVPCPGLLPTLANRDAYPVLCNRAEGEPAPCLEGGIFILDDSSFAVPPTYVGIGGRPDGHLVIAAEPRGGRSELLSCYHGRSLGAARVRGAPAEVVACPSGSGENSGHVLLRWEARDTIVVVSLHGVTNTNRRIALALASHVRLL